jgi:hypothetical protein
LNNWRAGFLAESKARPQEHPNSRDVLRIVTQEFDKMAPAHQQGQKATKREWSNYFVTSPKGFMINMVSNYFSFLEHSCVYFL